MGKAMKTKKILPEELIVEILLKLPIKSLMRFRCVCKSWYDLMESPNFVNMHLKHHSNNHDCILIMRSHDDRTASLSLHSYESLSFVSTPLQINNVDPNYHEIWGICNGLVCISDGITIALCNPAMREFKVLPVRLFPCPEPEGWVFNNDAIGFGFDPITNDYKVVTFVFLTNLLPPGGAYKAEIYSLNNNSWREIDYDHDHGHELPYVDYAPGFGTLYNGAFHWVTAEESILSFDMSTEVFRGIELPYIDLKERKRERLMVLNESLALFTFTEPQDQQQFVDIWVMHQYGVAESWTKQVTIGPLFGICHPFLLWKNEAILLENTEGRLISCAFDTHEMNDFNIHGIVEKLGVMVLLGIGAAEWSGTSSITQLKYE